MPTAVTLINPHSKKHKASDLKKTSHEEYDENGVLITNHYVEYTVIGKNRTWTDFMTLEEFGKLNPNIKLANKQSLK